MNTAHQVADVVLSIEAEMRHLGIWQGVSPSVEALASAQPFCFDTLAFQEWLQWIFLPRIKQIIEQGSDLPRQSAIFPLAEECLPNNTAHDKALLELIKEFDWLITSQSSQEK